MNWRAATTRQARGIETASPRSHEVHGCYALSAVAVAFDHVPKDLRKRLPRYPVPVAQLGRLAVDRSAAGQGLGEHLLMDDRHHMYLPMSTVKKLNLV